MSDGVAAWVGVVGVMAGVVSTELFNLVRGSVDRKYANRKELRERTRPDYEALLTWMKSASNLADRILFLRISGSESELGPTGKHIDTLTREFWDSFHDTEIDIAVVRIGALPVREAYVSVKQAIADLTVPLLLIRQIDTQTTADDKHLTAVERALNEMRTRMSHLEALIVTGLNPS